METSEAALQKVREDRLLIHEVDLWLYELIEPYIGKRVLEIGCGMGNFARHLLDRELYIGTDRSLESIAYMNNHYGGEPGFITRAVDACDSSFCDLSDYEVDTIFSLNVFEHIKDDRRALANAASTLQPGGNLILVVPAHDWLYGSIDRAIGHYRRYSKQTIIDRYKEVDLGPVKVAYINLLGAIGWFFNGRIRKQETPPSGQLKFFNRLVPIIKHVERNFPVPVGISLLAVGTKPGDK